MLSKSSIGKGRNKELEIQEEKIKNALKKINEKQNSPTTTPQPKFKATISSGSSNAITIKQEPTTPKPAATSSTNKKSNRFNSMLSQYKQLNPAKQTPKPQKPSVSRCFHEDDSDSDDNTSSSHKHFIASTSNNDVANKSALVRAKINQSALTAKVNAEIAARAATQQVKAAQQQQKRRKNRWGEKVAAIAPPGVVQPGAATTPQPVPAPGTNNLGLPNNYRPVGLVGVTELSDDQKKQLEEQREMQVMYDMIMSSRQHMMAQQQHPTLAATATSSSTHQPPTKKKKNRYAYDSDEEIDEKEGTWEHRQRRMEMTKTQELAEKLTCSGNGKHFIGDFLPPDQLEKFMETFKALKEGRTPDYSDYKDFKIQCDNIGFKMLQRMGWEEGAGLGPDGQGITAPVNKGKRSLDGAGVGIEPGDTLKSSDDDFSAYRKRMMLAYRFRPNPLNNPRRPYY